MKRLFILVEGPTEQTFVDELLYPVLLERGVFVTPHSMGGNIRWSRLKKDAVLFLKSDGEAFVTTFFDYYGLVDKKTDPFPGREGLGKFDTPLKKKRAIEDAIRRDVEEALGRRFDASRFLPYVQMHEFEGLLFSDPDVAAAGMFEPQIAPALRAIRALYRTPEDINDDRHRSFEANRAGLAQVRQEDPGQPRRPRDRPRCDARRLSAVRGVGHEA